MKNLRNLFYITAVAIAMFTVSCVGEFDNLDKFSGEIVYPAAFDTIIVSYGFERVELDLTRPSVGRIPSSEMRLGKAKKTVIEYDEERIVYEEVMSWVNITGLDVSRLYRFSVFTEDEHGNRSMPQEIAVIPFTQSDIDNMNFPSPSWLRSSTSVVVEYPATVINNNMVHNGLSWKYTDAAGQVQTGEVDGLRFFASNFQTASSISIEVTHNMIPRLSDAARTLILDEVSVTRTIQTQLPSAADPFVPAERAIMEANGITDFTPEGVASVTKLVYPLHTNSFQDLFYFSGVTEIDLTGEGIPLPTVEYDNNTVTSRIGGEEWQPFMRRVHRESDINIAGIATLIDLIEAGQITKIRFMTGGRMGLQLHEALEPYFGTVVELVDNFPDVVFMPPQFFVNGVVQATAWRMILSYSGDYFPRTERDEITKFDPANDRINNVPIDLKLDELLRPDAIYRCVMRQGNASFWFGLPTQYMFDSREYRYFKFKVLASPSVQSTRFVQQRLRIMNYTWAFTGESAYGQQNWDINTPNVEIGEWVECTVDMNSNNWWGNDIGTLGNGEGSRRNRVIVFNPGRETGTAFTWDENNHVVLYFADIRFSKTE